MRNVIRLVGGLGLAAGISATFLGSTAIADVPEFREVYDLIRSNLAGITEAELNQAAVQGLLQQLRPRVLLETNLSPESGESPANLPAVSKSSVFDLRYGYLRLARLDSGSADAFTDALNQLGASNQLNGLAIDLRYATGADYREACRIADRFLAEARPLLNWSGEELRSTAKTNAFTRPVMILANAQTTGAPEALAAMLRQANVGLVIGAPTAGQACVFKDFPLGNHERLRIATARARSGDGKEIPATGVPPDIQVTVAPKDESQYFNDPYKVVAKPVTTGLGIRGTNVGAAGTNRAPRVTEADLVRMRREGVNVEEELLLEPARPSTPERPIVTDPALARALDLLKGLAVVQATRPH